jgi:hypothetical protein
MTACREGNCFPGQNDRRVMAALPLTGHANRRLIRSE